jgi:hypothetical protein
MLKRLLIVAATLALSFVCFEAQARVSHQDQRGHRSHRAAHGFGGGMSRGCLTSRASSLLGRIEQQFGRVQIVSTCRPGATIASTGRRSKHASGEAIDFEAPRGKKAAVVKWLISNHRNGGTMTYNDMNHIHVDVGQHFVALGRPSGG